MLKERLTNITRYTLRKRGVPHTTRSVQALSKQAQNPRHRNNKETQPQTHTQSLLSLQHQHYTITTDPE
jgi:hypothetical protein